MKFTRQIIPDIILIDPTIFSDKRGYFSEIFRNDLLEAELGYKVNFIQENESKSSRGVLRGLHYQIPPYSQTKLVKVSEGRVLDIAVDLRKSSETFGNYVAIELSEENNYQVFIPPGFAHGFIVLSHVATLTYKVDNYYSAEHERGVYYDDENLAINWSLDLKDIILSEKDKSQPLLLDASKFD
jgi:dTDP-4-dehydrorhamnose 3,5-epimerase